MSRNRRWSPALALLKGAVNWSARGLDNLNKYFNLILSGLLKPGLSSSFPNMANGQGAENTAVGFVTLGMFIIDEFSFLEHDGSPTGKILPPQARQGLPFIWDRPLHPNPLAFRSVAVEHMQRSVHGYGLNFWYILPAICIRAEAATLGFQPTRLEW